MFSIMGEQVGIEHLAFYLPTDCYSVQGYLQTEPVSFSQVMMESHWKDIWFDSEILYRFFCEQSSGAKDGALLMPVERAAELFETSGIHGVYCASGETSSDMAIKVGKQILSSELNLVKNIDAVIFYHSTINEFPNWSTACRLQYDLGIKNALSFSISQKGANSSLMALKVACDMMAAEPNLNNFLLVGAEKFIPPYQRRFGDLTIVGDSASAMIFQRGGHRCQVRCIYICDFSEWWNPDTSAADQKEFFIAILADKATSVINRVIDQLNIGWNEIALLIPPNFNLSFIRSLSARAKIPWDKIYIKNIARFGYLENSDLVVNLKCALAERSIKQGDLVLVLNLGLGLSLGCAVVRV